MTTEYSNGVREVREGGVLSRITWQKVAKARPREGVWSRKVRRRRRKGGEIVNRLY